MVEKWLIVKSFWCMAFDFHEAEGALPSGESFGLVRYYLLCHSLELCFKAFLADKGATYLKLKQELGHNLEALLQECEANGLAESLSDLLGLREQVKWVNEYYADKQFEYSDICHYRLPDLKTLRESVGKLINVTKPLWREPEYKAATMQP